MKSPDRKALGYLSPNVARSSPTKAFKLAPQNPEAELTSLFEPSSVGSEDTYR